jgi:hypothetical protein
MNKTVTVHDKMQSGYSYELTQPMGKNFDPRFKPQLTPAQMLQLGIFGGIYMRDCTDEFPAEWFTDAKFAVGNTYDKNLNYFGIRASQSLAEWRRKGWIHRDDPRGWFQWYCRYYMGRRSPMEDDRQIRRWVNMRRHITWLTGACRPGDEFCRPRQRQALLHWAYDSRRI